jgi:hypothetical protein
MLVVMAIMSLRALQTADQNVKPNKQIVRLVRSATEPINKHCQTSYNGL